MASEGGGKIKPRRQHQDSRPYDRRQSLLGRMKDTVKDMLSPSWVIDLVNGVRKTPPPNSEQQEHGTPQLHQQPDGEVPVRRELNRMGNEEGLMMNQGMPQQQSGAAPNQQGTPLPNYNPQQMPYNTYRPPAPIPQHIMTNGDDQSDANEYSGPGTMCSNMIPLERKDYQNEMLHLNESRIRQMQQQMELHSESMSTQPNTSTDSANVSTVSDGSFLWSSTKPRSSRPQPPAKGSNPSFNISAFNSSLTTPKDPGYRHSPYYPGKTTFGGAAAHRKSRLNQSVPYEPSPMRKEVRARPLNNSALGGVTSSTAKRILDTLERMSSPLSDAKKIPYDANVSDTVLSMTPGTYRRRRTPSSSLSQSFSESSSGPPVARINTPSFASIATNRQTYPMPLPSHTVSAPKTNTPSQNEPPPSNPDKANARSGKMKRDRGTHYSSKPEEEEVEVPNLPTNFTLPVSNITLPKFDFGVAKPVNDTTKTAESPRVASPPNSPPAPFTFSSPIVESNSAAGSYSDSKSQNFKFSSPLAVDANGPKMVENTVSPNMQFSTSSSAPTLKRKQPEINFKPHVENNDMGFKPASELKSGSVMDILGKPSTELKKGSVMDILGKPKPTPNGSIAGIQAASSLKSGSVMDILGKPSSSSSGQSLSSLFKKSDGEWSCNTCLIKNKSDSDKCVACETPKPKPAPSKSVASAPAGSSLGTLFKKADGDWTCDTCLIKNKSDLSKCVACETPKPRPKSAAPGSSSLGGLFKKVEGEWTCDTCLIKNKSGVNKCVACETPKPGPKSAAPGAASVGGLFKKAEGEWTCDTCLIKNKLDVSKCVACETPRPGQVSGGSSLGGLFKKADGEWTCDTCLIKNKPGVSKCVACETPKPGPKPVVPVNNKDNDKKTIGFGNLSKKSSGSWECDTCLVSNKAESTKCVACETPKPGSKPTTGFTSSGGFKFASTGGFAFGAPASSTTTTAPATSGFTFGGSSSSTTAPSKTELPTASFSIPKDGGFSFGNASEKKEEKKSEKPASIPTNQFTSGLSDISAKPKNAVATEKPMFGSFGVKSTQESSSKEPAGVTGGFKFGNTPNNGETNALEKAKPTGGIQFALGSADATGSKPAAVPAGGFDFQFGKTNNTDKPVNNSTDGVKFQFGQPVSKDINKNDSKPLGTGGFQFPPTGGEKKDIAAPVFPFSAKPVEINATSQPLKTSPSSSSLFSDSKTSESAPKPVFGNTVSNDKPSLPTGGFQFGTGSASTAGFVFGATNNKPAEKTPSSTFTFGAAGSAENKAAPSSNFTFGATTGKPAETPASGGFNFNPASSNALSANKRVRDDMEGGSEAKKGSFTFSSTPADGTFKFGDKPTSTTNSTPGFTFGQSNTPAFGAAKTENTPQGGGFGSFSASSGQTNTAVFGGTAPANSSVFGSTPAPAFGSTTSTPAPVFGSATSTPSTGGVNLTTPSGFNFGGASTTPSSGLFQFSASNNQATAAAPGAGTNTGFNFDQSGTPAQPTAPAAAPAPTFNAAPPAINFTGQPQAPGMFNFSAASTPGDNPFSATGAGNAGPRRFKKAVRKLRK